MRSSICRNCFRLGSDRRARAVDLSISPFVTSGYIRHFHCFKKPHLCIPDRIVILRNSSTLIINNSGEFAPYLDANNLARLAEVSLVLCLSSTSLQRLSTKACVTPCASKVTFAYLSSFSSRFLIQSSSTRPTCSPSTLRWMRASKVPSRWRKAWLLNSLLILVGFLGWQCSSR